MPKADSDKLLQQGYDLIQTGKAQDLQKAEECFEQAYKQGNADALTGLLVLANAYNSKEKLTLGGKELCWDADVKDNQKAYEILIKIKEALHGEDVLPGGLRLSDEFIQLGGVFEASGETENLRQALECYKIADTLGNAEGAFQYAELITFQRSLSGFCSVICDIKRILINGSDTFSEKFYTLAANHGSSKAMRKLSWMYYEESGISRGHSLIELIDKFFSRLIILLFAGFVDFALIIEFFYVLFDSNYAAQAAVRMDTSVAEWLIRVLCCIFCCSIVIFNFAIRPRISRKKLLKKSWQWITKAATSGDIISLAQQAYYLFAGIGTTPNPKEAITLFKKAADQNNLNALAFLGNAYEKGLSVTSDEEKAQDYYQRAAKQDITNPENETLALYWLADVYKRGEFVLQNLEFAEQCFQQSKKMLLWGNTLYGSSLAALQPKGMRMYLTKQQKKEARRFQQEYRRTELLKAKIVELQQENTELKNALTQYQESISKAYAAWSNTDASSQNDADYFALCEKISQKAAESQETEYEKAKRALQERFGEYWNRLQPDSQIGLISARTLYELSIQQNATTFDFSGVCISATSALELELKKIFLTDYVKFVKKESFVPDKWPEVLRYWSSDSQKWKAKDRFTLGDLPYILESTQAHGSAPLNNYLKSILNSNLRKANDPRKPFLTAKGDRPSFLNRIDNLREKYRNPAGHAGAVDKESAKNCCYQIMGSFEAETRLDDTESLLVELLSMLK